MNKKLVSSLIITAVVSTGLLAGCGAKKEASTDALKDGKYKAEASDFDDKGWKPFVEMEVNGGKIATVKFDYTNKDGKFKSEDAEYNKNMEAKVKTGPAKYTKQLSEDLVAKQDPAKVDTVTGATHSTDNFKKLSTQLVDNAKKGDTAVSKVTIK
ncbi:FMN-binding protein [Clostridium sp. CX1]|uniref:FMN-binding protein n=1 Tax=Clostridium tanneri TaxID=3037988 RepID=A0ABU4JYC2_9CLOT|nr:MULTISPECIES: FMN-binding protein [unclassified Clostridium]MCT8978615.1 FMN-binding protein [Clostridium sp. CX1]MDW8802874.1 FMN-binding protein [Clostridium sp. A1-XYC3]